MVIGSLFAAVFACITIYLENRNALYLTATQIPPLSYGLLFFAVIVINPLLRLLRFIRPLTLPELMVIFLMGMVSSGISTFGLSGPLIPIIGGLFNDQWNNDQSAWSLQIEPFINEAYFVSEPGIRDAAANYREAYLERDRLRRVHDAAVAVDNAGKRAARIAAEVETLQSSTGERSAQADELRACRQSLAEVRADQTAAEQKWQALGPGSGFATVPAALAACPAAMDVAGQRLDERTAVLRRLEEKAFAKIIPYRRGLPEGKRATPGIMPTPADDSRSYWARWRRLVTGRKALQALVQARDLIVAAEVPISTAVAEQAAELLQRTSDILAPLADDRLLVAEQQAATAEAQQLNKEIAALAGTYKELTRAHDNASATERSQLESRLRSLKKQQKRLRSQQRTRVLKTSRLRREAVIAGLVHDTIGELAAVRAALANAEPEKAVVLDALTALELRFPQFDASLWRFVAGDIPWSHWLAPLGRWCLVIGLTYLALMTLNVLIFRQWAEHEKLVYPLAEIPQIFAATDGDSLLPKIFYNGLFWLGVLVAAVPLGWNLLCALDLNGLSGLTPLDLQNRWTPYIADSPLDALVGRFGRSMVFFTVIGITFMTPKHVSFSLWSFSLLFMLMVLVLTSLGHEIGSSNMLYRLNFRTAMGGGALLVFATIVLYKCRRYLFCVFAPASVDGLPLGERRELRISSLLFVAACLAIILILWLGMGANPGFVVLVCLITLLVNIAFMRAVAEGGLLGFKSYFNPIHFIRNVFGFDRPWCSAPLFAPLVMVYAVLFFDVKTLMAPAMATSLKIRQDQCLERLRFHLAIGLGIVLAVVTTIVTTLLMSYAGGADSLEEWFHSGLPRFQFSSLAEMVGSPLEASATNTRWLVAGALLMAALLFFRRRLFWLPHPIGLLMFVNPMMGAYWFSIFLGWMANALVTKYGTREIYYRVRGFFMGLVVGEILLVLLAAVLAYWLDLRIPIDLNRN